MSNQFNIGKKSAVVVNAVTLSTAYQNSALLDIDTCNFLGLYISYTKGDEVGVKIKIEGTLDVSLGLQATLSAAGTNWYQRVAESTTGGVTTIVGDVLEITATGKYLEVVNPLKADGVKISVIADTLGAAPGTITIYAVASWV